MKWVNASDRMPDNVDCVIRYTETKEVVEIDEIGESTISVWNKRGKDNDTELVDFEWLDESQPEIEMLKKFIDRCNMNDRFPDLVREARKLL